MGLQDQEKIKEGCETGFGGDTEPCQSPWKSRKTRPWKNHGEAKNSPTLVRYVSRKRAHRKKKLLRKATGKLPEALGSFRKLPGRFRKLWEGNRISNSGIIFEQERGLRGGERRGWCEKWSRSG